MELIGRATGEIHPAGPRPWYLWMIGVTPDRRGEGLGTALMMPVLDDCDREGRLAYLEAEQRRQRRLYERLGFTE
ncbi:Acetyltransferase OS=Streptomyces glaucescens OX=1907 GN=SGLAU_22610 PE=4 SV=1 [Streptomyces glaucescens]